MAYMRAIGLLASVIIFVAYIIANSFVISSNLWLASWSNDIKLNRSATYDDLNGTLSVASSLSTATAPTPAKTGGIMAPAGGTSDSGPMPVGVRLGGYIALGLGQGIFILIGSLIMAYFTVGASTRLHAGLIRNLFKSPMAFYDVTPIGRIINRCGKDVDVVDNTLPMTFRMWLNCVLSVTATLAVIVAATPIFAAVIGPLAVFYYFIQRFYVSTSRQLKRLESVSRSPIYSHFQEAIQGASSIRAYQAQARFVTDSEVLVDENNRAYYPNITSNRWLAIRLETVGNAITFFAALFAVLRRDNLSAGLAGLSISYAMSITQILNWAVRMTSELETNVVAVERIKEYSVTPTEANWRIEQTQPDKEWPSEGQVTFDNYQVRYRPGLELVIHGISCNIRGGEKVGIVGRTGAGKSSLTMALFRIIEAAGGKILIDGIDIATLGLHDLRSRITIIPQEPVLFTGTLRLNLDPFSESDDPALWTALELSHLKEFVAALPEKLEYYVAEGGENLSVGQRQLLCLARALLRKTKVLVLDEATSAIDQETESIILETIRTEFRGSTILTIAHRLNTILDSTRILVLDKGRVAEFAPPEELLADKNSAFYGMAKDAGLA
jgi:ABC-type multidrug transport system fused ATPase/permease subunit